VTDDSLERHEYSPLLASHEASFFASVKVESYPPTINLLDLSFGSMANPNSLSVIDFYETAF